MALISDPTSRITCEQFWEHLQSDNPAIVKNAQDALNSFLRMQVREEGILRAILPPIAVGNSDLDRQVDTDKPVVVLDKEPNSPAAVSIPFATQPFARYIKAPRYRIMFDRISTPRFMKDVDELRTYDMDIRQILSDNAVKDMLAEEDGKLIATVNVLLGTIDSTVPETGVSQYRSITGGVTRDSVNDFLKILPSTPSHLEAATIVVNNVTIKDVQKWGYDEIGGPLSEEILRNGFAERNLLNTRMIVTIKRRLVVDNEMYGFAEPKYLGKMLVLTDTTMYIKREAYMLEFSAYESVGAAIGNVAAICRGLFS
ncbi:MAG: hypothetical protein DRP45_11460 [Candidatus Zixiibacteriota bacterium]|nr:MAG: hypothetical protein DRP45_11460 [candidate division Zixibacteria bacterium]